MTFPMGIGIWVAPFGLSSGGANGYPVNPVQLFLYNKKLPYPYWNGKQIESQPPLSSASRAEAGSEH